MNNPTQSDTATQIPKSVQETAKQRTVLGHSRYPKTHVNYWKARLYRNTYTRDGQTFETGGFCVKIQYLGVRKTIPLGLADKEKSATKARDIYLDVVAKGWEVAEAAFNPEMVVRKDDPSVGDFLAEVEAKAGLKVKTLRNYTRCLRTIVSGIFGIDGGRARFDYQGGGHAAWAEKIDRIRLADITSDKVQAWKVAYLKAAGSSPAKARTARRNSNTLIRCARSLFAPKTIKHVKLRLPAPLPFDGVETEKAGSMRYKSTINPALILAAAKRELKAKEPEQYIILLLALCCGLRRAEIDGLEWSALDFAQNRIVLKLTDTLELKTEESAGAVDVDPEVMRELRQFMAGSKTTYVVASKVEPRPGAAYQHYRANVHFNHLAKWLRGQGIASRKPLHELRKEFGSLVNARHGIYAASAALRHGSIGITAAHYLANKKRATVGLGKLLTESEIRIETKDKEAAA